MKYRYLYIVALMIIALGFCCEAKAQVKKSAFKIARVKYNGGGDWYNDPSAEVNLLAYTAKVSNIPIDPVYEYVDLSSDNLFAYPMIFLTGHGNINFTDREAKNLRSYLDNGGFLLVDDDYGIDEYFRKEMKKVYPDQKFAELPFNHGIYHSHFKFPNGLPKTHEHDKKPPQGFGLFENNRLAVFYIFESNISDGWADPKVHNDPPEVREKALQMGVNIIVWALTH